MRQVGSLRRILFVFEWLVVGGEETEVRLLAKHLDPARYRVEVVACFHKPEMPEQTHRQLRTLGVPVDRTLYPLDFEEKVRYLARKLIHYDVLVACQAVKEIYPALDRAIWRPPLIEHGGLASEATETPKYWTSRYVGVCDSICRAACSIMPERQHHVLEIPSMVDLSEFDPSQRAAVRHEWGLDENTPVVGWVGRLDRKKRVEDFILAARRVHARVPQAHFIVIGGPDAFMPEYAEQLRALARACGMANRMTFLGDCADVPRLISALDIFAWLSHGEGMPHVISEAGAAGLPVVATADNGTQEQITESETGLFVEHENPASAAAAITRLINDADLRRTLGANLRRKIEREYGTTVLVPRWEQLFSEVMAEEEPSSRVTISSSLSRTASRRPTRAGDLGRGTEQPAA